MGGYQPTSVGTTIVEYNEVAFNVWGAKWVGSQQNAIVRHNFVHDNSEGGYWCDFCGPNFRFENNTVTDNGGQGLVIEGPCGSTAQTPCARVIANNTVSGHPTHGIFITTASGTEVYGNTISNNGQSGVQLFIHALNLGNPVADLRDNYVHDNFITVPASTAWAADMRCWNCTATQAEPWVSNAKNNRYEHNHYDVPDVTAADWYWQGFRTWSQWQALGHDDAGTVE
jgi:parallel beta-helix repeat protein